MLAGEITDDGVDGYGDGDDQDEDDEDEDEDDQDEGLQRNSPGGESLEWKFVTRSLDVLIMLFVGKERKKSTASSV